MFLLERTPINWQMGIPKLSVFQSGDYEYIGGVIMLLRTDPFN